jgi:hypothetical protein
MAEIKGVGTDKRMCQRLLFFMIDFFNAEAFYLKRADVTFSKNVLIFVVPS